MAGRKLFGAIPQLIPEWFGKPRIIENPDLAGDGTIGMIAIKDFNEYLAKGL
jgi:hypothetical protein